LTIHSSVLNNDAFLYFSAVEKGYTPRFLNNISVVYNVPATLTDHLNQTSRYQRSYTELAPYFNLDLRKEYRVPKFLSAIILLKYLLLQPQYAMSYLGIKLWSKLSIQKSITSTWDLATTTKKGITV
jgi:hypothetical protein